MCKKKSCPILYRSPTCTKSNFASIASQWTSNLVSVEIAHYNTIVACDTGTY